ncbi:DUF998 domain-containing protein [Gordonia neofelifaecis]|uniref:DUF998 domain-containing protein n=1 Tax=Gordonia neofelifaecis NRRL B-59395 TaxID=644548 RepID=F1YN93_9ACTN|nr:DUF998 domain-containing protein [Gordonia neofelifaecis]EGD53804.1 hypothetical protein SCNU_16948 [Gordonia neofelifaecis NRRL B-59395]
MLVLAGICYSSWILDFFFHSGLDPMRSFLSELDSGHMPHRNVYVAGDVLTGVFTLAAAVGLLFPPRLVRNKFSITAAIAIGAFGASTIADALMPIECLAGRDPGCPDQSRGLLPQLEHIHALTSSLAVIAIFVAMVAASLAAWRRQDWQWLRYGGGVVFAIVVLATVWMLAADRLGGDYRLGLAQRIQVGGMSVWMAFWGVAISRWGRVTESR